MERQFCIDVVWMCDSISCEGFASLDVVCNKPNDCVWNVWSVASF